MMLQYSEAFAKMGFVGCNKVHMHFQGVHTRCLQIFSLSFQLCSLQTYKQKENLKNHHLLADFGRRSMSVVDLYLMGNTYGKRLFVIQKQVIKPAHNLLLLLLKPFCFLELMEY